MESEVLAANRAFYDAFARRDLAAMDALWSRRMPVACIHPGWSPLRGRDQVMASWRAILGGGGAPAIRCSGATAHLVGDGAAYVVCVESVPGARLVATNLFVREDGHWRLVHHQAAPVARAARDGGADPGDHGADEEPPKGTLLN